MYHFCNSYCSHYPHPPFQHLKRQVVQEEEQAAAATAQAIEAERLRNELEAARWVKGRDGTVQGWK